MSKSLKTKMLLDFIEPPSSGTVRIIAFMLSTSSNIIQRERPTLYYTHEEKDKLYEALDKWKLTTGLHSPVSPLTEGTRSTRSASDCWRCAAATRCVINNFFKCKEIYQVSWGHPVSSPYAATTVPTVNNTKVSAQRQEEGLYTNQHLLCKQPMKETA
ncbi:hypothetical protein CHS0354_028535, partial [Potamilus streckersoni]